MVEVVFLDVRVGTYQVGTEGQVPVSGPDICFFLVGGGTVFSMTTTLVDPSVFQVGPQPLGASFILE